MNKNEILPIVPPKGELSRQTIIDIARCLKQMEAIRSGTPIEPAQPPSYLVRNGAATPDELGSFQEEG